MANLKDIRVRITSVSSTMQITSAMKMVSAAKLRKAQDAILQIRPYASKLHEILTNLTESLDNIEDNPYAANREVKKVLVVCISSNRGLCGAFNSGIVKKTVSLSEEFYGDVTANGKLSVACIGKKGNDLLKHRQLPIAESHHDIFDNLCFDTVAPIAEAIMKHYVDGEYDRVDLVYNKFKNAAVQLVTREQFLPIEMKPSKAKAGRSMKKDYIFEPSKEYIVQELIPKSLKIQFYKAILDSHASEHGARMTAMHKATENASDMIKELKLTYNKARQAAITKEILEIVGGAEALQK